MISFSELGFAFFSSEKSLYWIVFSSIYKRYIGNISTENMQIHKV